MKQSQLFSLILPLIRLSDACQVKLKNSNIIIGTYIIKIELESYSNYDTECNRFQELFWHKILYYIFMAFFFNFLVVTIGIVNCKKSEVKNYILWSHFHMTFSLLEGSTPTNTLPANIISEYYFWCHENIWSQSWWLKKREKCHKYELIIFFHFQEQATKILLFLSPHGHVVFTYM